MCTVVILKRPTHRWPLLLAGNRDEHVERPFHDPDYHWDAQPDVCGGLDLLAGGTWLAVNKSGMIATVLNQENTLGFSPEKHSRGELVLEALQHDNAKAAMDSLKFLKPDAYKPFYLLIADVDHTYLLTNVDDKMHTLELKDEINMLTGQGLNNPACPRTKEYLQHFQKTTPPDPDENQYDDWKRLLTSTVYDVDAGVDAAMKVTKRERSVTVCHSIIALPSPDLRNIKPKFINASVFKGEGAFKPVNL